MHPKKVLDVYQLDPFLLLVGVRSRDEQGTIRGGGQKYCDTCLPKNGT